MEILIINVSLRPNSPVKFLPVGLAYIATAIKNAGFHSDLLDIDVYRYTDAEMGAIIARKKYDVFCLGTLVTGYSIIKKITQVIRNHHPDSKIIVGNAVADSIPNILLSRTSADIAVLGEGDITIVELLQSLDKGEGLTKVAGIVYKDSDIKFTQSRPVIKDLSTIPLIDYSMWDLEKYIEGFRNSVSEPLPMPREKIRGIGINTARGCINRCTFCYHVFRNAPYRHRPWRDVLKEIGFLIKNYQINYVSFFDELTFYSKKSVRDFIDAYDESGLDFFWTGDCRGNLFNSENDLPMLHDLKRIGCTGLGYSLESSSPEILKAMNKRMTAEQFSFQTALLQRAEIPVKTSLVFGYPQETPETIQATIECCIRNRLYPSAGYLLPLPGSEMYKWAVENGFISDEEEYLLRMGDRQDLYVNLTRISDDEFQKILNDELKRCNKMLDVHLDDSHLLKTQFYRKAK